MCNPLGTAGNKCNPSSGACNCKPLVIGEKCDQCTVGYYGYSEKFPETCLKCHCTGKTSDCDIAPGMIDNNFCIQYRIFHTIRIDNCELIILEIPRNFLTANVFDICNLIISTFN